mgnify:FL=1
MIAVVLLEDVFDSIVCKLLGKSFAIWWNKLKFVFVSGVKTQPSKFLKVVSVFSNHLYGRVVPPFGKSGFVWNKFSVFILKRQITKERWIIWVRRKRLTNREATDIVNVTGF